MKNQILNKKEFQKTYPMASLATKGKFFVVINDSTVAFQTKRTAKIFVNHLNEKVA